VAATATTRGEEDAPPDPAGALDHQIRILETELASLQGEEATLSRDVDLLGTREAISRRRHQRAIELRKSVTAQVLEEEERQQRLSGAMVESRIRARAALREIYKQSSMAGYASVLSVSDPREILRGIQQLDVVSRRHRDAVRLFADQSRESEATRERLEARKAALDRVVREAASEEALLGRSRQERLTLLNRVQAEKEMHQEAAAELRRATEALTEAIASLPPGSPPPAISVDFARLRGTLPWPAAGPVAVPYGQVRHPRFGTVTPHPGVDIRVSPGSPVKAVAAGRILFSRRFGGYGRTVVIDHGGRYLSVYARLAAATVSEGADVLPGEEIGFAAEADVTGKSNVYLEIRHLGLALDPQEWLRRSAATGAGR
jgi:septal ring factor EnvC (AmiA/AmiB activator)